MKDFEFHMLAVLLQIFYEASFIADLAMELQMVDQLLMHALAQEIIVNLFARLDPELI